MLDVFKSHKTYLRKWRYCHNLDYQYQSGLGTSFRGTIPQCLADFEDRLDYQFSLFLNLPQNNSWTLVSVVFDNLAKCLGEPFTRVVESACLARLHS